MHFPGLHGASRAATARRARQLRQMTNPLRNGHSVHDDNNHVYYNDSDLFPVLLELHHSSGVLAKWQVRFDPGSALSSVATVECLARCAGHTANISTVVAHPSLPCALTLAKSTHMTQIALWKVCLSIGTVVALYLFICYCYCSVFLHSYIYCSQYWKKCSIKSYRALVK